MTDRISPRLAAIVDALPLCPGMRVLEIGCGPGAAARTVLRRIGRDGYILAIDRSLRAISQALAASQAELRTGCLEFRCVAIENFKLIQGEMPFDLAFGIRVGVLDGRHPVVGQVAISRIRDALIKGAKLFIDGGHPLKEIILW